MKTRRLFFLLATTLNLVLISMAASHLSECAEENEPPFIRLMLITFDGKGAVNGTLDDFTENYGVCHDVLAHADKGFDYLEKAFGLDMSVPREDPLTYHSLDNYDIHPMSVNHRTSRALIGSFYEFGEYMNAPVFNSYWRLSIKAAAQGNNGMADSGTFLYFGLLRLRMNNRDFCMDFYSEEPVVGVNNGINGYELQPFALYNERWGSGASIGVLHDESNKRNERQSYFWVIRFPGKGYY